EGFETIGIMPLRRGKRTFGVLQFNWRRTAAITWEKFLFLERVAENAARSLVLQERHEHLQERLHAHHCAEESQGEVVLRLTPDGTMAYVNPAFCEAVGVARSALLGRSLVDLCIPADRRKLGVVLLGLPPHQPSRGIEIRVPVNGCIRWLQLQFTGLYRESQSLVEVRVQGRDMTMRRRVEKGLRETLQMLGGVFRRSPLPILALDQNGLVMLWNPTAEKIFGYTAEEQVGTVLPVSDTAGDAGFLREWQAMIRDGAARTLSIQLHTCDGRDMDVIMSTGILTDEKGNPAGGVCICFDYDEVSRPRIRREKWESQLVRIQRMEALGRLAGGIAHDFNSQLTTIMGYADMLLEELPAESSSRKWVGEILSATRRSAALTERMLAYSRAHQLKPELFDWNRLLSDLEKTFLRTLTARIELQIQTSANPALVFSDLAQCEQTLMHLVLNAADAMPLHGKLLIDVKNETVFLPRPCVHGTIPVGTYVMVAVEDNGVGMDAAVQARIFEPFFTTKAVGKGSGLGLSMVLGFIQQSGGFITLRSACDTGTRIELYFPAVASDQIERLRDVRVSATESIDTILIAIRDNDERDRLLQRVRGLGYRALSVSRGDLVLDFCRRFGESIHLIVLDAELIEAPGITEFRQTVLREHPEARVLLLTADEAGVAQAWAGHPARQLLQRPATEGLIIARIEDLL
ncbi:MAG TPA: PAS domain-containing protein, partial [Candidatus Ozemobacteraceae bacterium]|nr:PAS domain-containing protein [Candidatus Ozemobacteraceae bacterium]